MNFADLTDTDFSFKCNIAQDACEHWDYQLFIDLWDYQYSRNLNRCEIDTLRKNCKRILQATDSLQGERQ